VALPPGTRTPHAALLAGDVLAGRYRLDRAVPSATPGQTGPAELWLAQDEVLARPVAVKVLLGGRATPLLEAAAAAGAVAHPGLARVYDAAIEQHPAERAGRAADAPEVAYVISEWVDGPGLADVLAQDGPWDPGAAVLLGGELADALDAAHARGVVHGRLHPGNVLLTSRRAVKLTDLAVSASLPGRPRGLDPADDVRGLSAVLYAALTARWPASTTTQPGGGLPPAPRGREGATGPPSPRQVRAGVPRALDDVVRRALDPVQAADRPDLTTATGLAAALAGAVHVAPPGVPAATRPPRLSPGARRRLPAAAVLLVLATLGIGAWSLDLPSLSAGPRADQLEPLTSSQTDGTATPQAPVPLAQATVTDFDPPPGDGRERPSLVGRATDGDPASSWLTERYSSAPFGGLKPGVGLLVDLGEPTEVGRVELVLGAAGTDVEIRVGDVAAPDAKGFTRVAAGTSDGDGLALALPAGTQARYYLVWITRLPQVDSGHLGGIADLRLSRP